MTDQTVRPHKSTTHREMFYHIVVATQTPVMDAETGKVTLEWVGHPRYQSKTVFAREELPGSNIWQASVACCIHDDVFNRKQGRNTARKNYFQKSKFRMMRVTGSRDEEGVGTISYPTHEDAVNFAASWELATKP